MISIRFLFPAFLAAQLLSVSVANGQSKRPLVQEFAGSTILLTSGDTLRGPVTLRRDQDVLLMAQPDGTITTLSAVSINSFAVKGEEVDSRRGSGYYDNFYDARNGYFYGNPMYGMPRQRPETEDRNRVRVFRTFRWNRGNDYSDFKSPAFFEQLSNGPRMLLRRESLVERTMNTGPYGYGYGAGRYLSTYTQVKDDFYLATPAGDIIPLRNPKKDLLAVFQGQSRQIEQYVRDNKLSFTVARELAFIVNYANSLVKQ
ncbi:hypothetical protein [Hymenobacter psychrotolerans]|uniref:DUF4136 domain-containing protein n=1 Tax=Hymenobacter psychrotolerans DSM 18569 TaxID=1121959 RepID=A0A1M6SU35_9BACT|nr:hypothetical protein [Hymenobacter psychrotolerans]SHK48234.1 hypothetical protein SAMN02746009_00980 [Hymenobacter psychrotolerans DSM 18569]